MLKWHHNGYVNQAMCACILNSGLTAEFGHTFVKA